MAFVPGDNGNNVLVGGADDDQIMGYGGHDDLTGLGGNDIIDGGTGVDIMRGGLGDDIFWVNAIGEQVIEGADGGYDHVNSMVDFDLPDHVESLYLVDGFGDIDGMGNELDNRIIGNFGDNTLSGGNGNDWLDGGDGEDVLLGGDGDDIYWVDDEGDIVAEFADLGDNDQVNVAIDGYVLDMNIERLAMLTTAGSIDASGNSLGNMMFGNADNNTLDGLGGADTLRGGEGNDTLDGGTSPDILMGQEGNDVMDGGSSADTMYGATGNDWFFVNQANDQVYEYAGEGILDRVFASASYALAHNAEVEVLSTTDHEGTAEIDLTGNNLTNVIYGNDGDNILDGGAGADALLGRDGNDWYYVDNAADTASEVAGEGTADRVLASVDYTLSATTRVEILTTANDAGVAGIDLTGNGFGNTIQGNAGSNILDGAAGTDILIGLGGNDWFRVDSPDEWVIELVGGGADQVFASVDYTLGAGVHVEVLSTNSTPGVAPINLVGNELGNTILGNAGSNALKGVLGNDILMGMGGADAFVFNTALHAVNNVDTILDFTPADDDIILAQGIFATIALGTLAASAFVIGSGALDADDRIIYNPTTGALIFDPAGTAGGTPVQFATLTPGLALTNADFIVV